MGNTAMSEQPQKQPKVHTPFTLVVMLLLVVVAPFLPLLISRQWAWWAAWIYGVIAVLGFALSRFFAARRYPDLLAERVRSIRHLDAAPWDKVLSPLVGLGSVLILLVVGLDALYGWSPPFSLPVKLVALCFILAGYVLGSYALIANRYFSGTVRIQSERGHELVTGGPYRWLRHPGYAGAIMTYMATPFFLDSRWALLPALFISLALVLRTSLEDKLLQGELAGYRDYTTRVRYRLLPGIW